jgi:hypothetical protein
MSIQCLMSAPETGKKDNNVLGMRSRKLSSRIGLMSRSQSRTEPIESADRTMNWISDGRLERTVIEVYVEN